MLRAPFDGVVAQSMVYKGQSIAVNEPVIKLQSIDSIDIVVKTRGHQYARR